MAITRDDKRELEQAKKQLATERRAFEKDKQEWKLKKGDIQRETVRLRALRDTLERQNKVLEEQQTKFNDEVDHTKLRQESLLEKNTKLEKENQLLETNIDQATKQFEEIKSSVETRNASLDQELENYALVRKQEIKDNILKVNEELVGVKTELVDRKSELQSIKDELGQINEVFKTEQEELKLSNAETEKTLIDNKEKVAETQVKVDDLEYAVKELEYNKNKLEISMVKIKEEHDKFLEYEKNAKKILDNKDRQLQEKAADVATSNQFLKNQRSYLPEM